MLNWFYNWIAEKSGIYRKAIEEQTELKKDKDTLIENITEALTAQAKLEKSNQSLGNQNYRLTDENSQLRKELTEAESFLEIEERKGDFLEEKVEELTQTNKDQRKMAVSKDFIDTLLKRAKAPLIYVTKEGEINYNPLSAEVLKITQLKKISDLDLSGWSSIPIRDLEGNEVGRFYSNSSERTFFETVKRLYTEIIGERKARKLVKQTLSRTQYNS